MSSDRAWFDRRRLRLIVTERPGFGASDRLPGHGLAEPAEDVMAILDSLGIERAWAWAGSGGAPYLLAWLQRHPDRVSAATVVSGTAPLSADEVAGLIPMNAAFVELALGGNVDALHDEASHRMVAMLADPTAAFRSIMASAPERDRRVMEDPAWQGELVRSTREAFRQGVDGWVDELLALRTRWDDVDPTAIRTDLTWWHASDDRNVPSTAARRLIEQLPNARMRALGSGHLEAYHRRDEIFDELLGRGSV